MSGTRVRARRPWAGPPSSAIVPVSAQAAAHPVTTAANRSSSVGWWAWSGTPCGHQSSGSRTARARGRRCRRARAELRWGCRRPAHRGRWPGSRGAGRGTGRAAPVRPGCGRRCGGSPAAPGPRAGSRRRRWRPGSGAGCPRARSPSTSGRLHTGSRPRAQCRNRVPALGRVCGPHPRSLAHHCRNVTAGGRGASRTAVHADSGGGSALIRPVLRPSRRPARESVSAAAKPAGRGYHPRRGGHRHGLRRGDATAVRVHVLRAEPHK